MTSKELHEDTLLPVHASVQVLCTTCKYCLVSPRHVTQKLKGVQNLVLRLSLELLTEMFIPWLQPLY